MIIDGEHWMRTSPSRHEARAQSASADSDGMVVVTPARPPSSRRLTD